MLNAYALEDFHLIHSIMYFLAFVIQQLFNPELYQQSIISNTVVLLEQLSLIINVDAIAQIVQPQEFMLHQQYNLKQITLLYLH